MNCEHDAMKVHNDKMVCELSGKGSPGNICGLGKKDCCIFCDQPKECKGGCHSAQAEVIKRYMKIIQDAPFADEYI